METSTFKCVASKKVPNTDHNVEWRKKALGYAQKATNKNTVRSPTSNEIKGAPLMLHDKISAFLVHKEGTQSASDYVLKSPSYGTLYPS